MDIATIDKNLSASGIGDTPMEWISSFDARFSVHGVFYDEKEGLYMRVPDAVSMAANPGLAYLSRNTSGGRLRFVTNSPYIAIKGALPAITPMPHMSITGSHGFSVYADGIFQARYSPVFKDFKDIAGNPFEGNVCFAEKKNLTPSDKKRRIEIYFPLYGGVKALYIGVAPGSVIEAAPDYTYKKPLLFYGSSITQGACVSRPGNDYVSVLARKLDSEYINLGFSGSGNAEDAMLEYITSIDASVYAFDYNLYANHPGRVLPPHFSIYERIRKKHPAAAILLLDKPGCDYDANPEREAAIRSTYDKALQLGDKRVAYLPAWDFLGEGDRDACMVDNAHPNDLGAMRMASALYPVVKKLLAQTEENNL